MILTHAHREVLGSSADLFFNRADGRVYKLFRRGESDRATRRARAVFEAERDAYSILQRVPALKPHAPAFYGCLEITSVENDNETEFTSRYLCDCCYSLELVSGAAIGVFEVPMSCRQSILDLMERFEVAGIKHVADASVFHWDDASRMQVIDFATYDAFAGILVMAPDPPCRLSPHPQPPLNDINVNAPLILWRGAYCPIIAQFEATVAHLGPRDSLRSDVNVGRM